MIVVDTSAWVEHLRATESATDRRLSELLQSAAEIAVTEVVVGEVLAGVPDRLVAATRDWLLGFPLLRLRKLADFEASTALFRACRDAGEAVRDLADCLVAVPTIGAGATLLHADRDFDKLRGTRRSRCYPSERSSRATVSTWGVWGNMSTGRARTSR